ncbi:AfsR/SARP family transcriptional regulator [Thermoactinospora rubra]|uniref:AfsR/SARP family transcriptional regulator n=1 Tax=Thermoactinospora rubra TaxID=1088767 RepID=UPI000A0FA0A9|nr:AfsR/SARP family transcriptional regulator [Thermoactinospora rubra]
MATFKVLGPLEIAHDGRSCTPTPHKLRQVLALLVLRANQIVPTDLLVQELWGDDPPKSAQTTLHTYVYQLRKLMERDGLCRRGEEPIQTRPPGYLLRAGQADVDAFVFERLARRGRRLLEDGDAARAAAVLREALDLWSGPALADVIPGPVLQGHAVALEEERVRALELRIQADLALGRHRDLIAELRLLVAVYPFNEWFHGQLITALGRSHRRGEALEVYHALRRRLDEELGLAPSPELQELYRELLSVGVPARRAS